jgi:cytoskeletal protein CcmA (bactofilin family)
MSIMGSKRTDEAPPPAGGLSIVAFGMTVNGDLDSQGTVKVEGAVNGQIRSRGQVLVARDGAVVGDIEAREAIVGGVVQGSIRAEERVEVQAGASIEGDITTRRIMVAEGGLLNGLVHMAESVVEAQSPKAVDAA